MRAALSRIVVLAACVPQLGCAVSHVASGHAAVARTIDADGLASVVTLADDSVYTWGDRAPTELPDSDTPWPLAELRGATQAVLTSSRVCALIAGHVTCLGPDLWGVVRATDVAEIGTATALESATFSIFARSADDRYWRVSPCPELPPGVVVTPTCQPSLAAGLPASAIVRALFGIMLARGGDVVMGGFQQDGTRAQVGQPTRPELADAIGMTRVEMSGCVLLVDTTVRCWDGRLEGWDGEVSAAVMRDPGLRNVAEVAHNGTGLALPDPNSVYCARLTDGAVWCWGSNGCGTRELIDHRTTAPSPSACTNAFFASPHQIALPGRATRIVTGTHHACALVEDGFVYCWGSNYHGQLGDGTRVDSAEPVRVHLPGAGS